MAYNSPYRGGGGGGGPRNMQAQYAAWQQQQQAQQQQMLELLVLMPALKTGVAGEETARLALTAGADLPSTATNDVIAARVNEVRRALAAEAQNTGTTFAAVRQNAIFKLLMSGGGMGGGGNQMQQLLLFSALSGGGSLF